jgi:hypothetical protein
MMQKIEKQERGKKELLKEGYLEMAEENIQITKEWEKIDKKWR